MSDTVKNMRVTADDLFLVYIFLKNYKNIQASALMQFLNLLVLNYSNINAVLYPGVRLQKFDNIIISVIPF